MMNAQWDLLASAIYEKAIEDYRDSVRKIFGLRVRKSKDGKTKHISYQGTRKTDRHRIIEAFRTKCECERFFMRDPWSGLTGVKGVYILNAMREQCTAELLSVGIDENKIERLLYAKKMKEDDMGNRCVIITKEGLNDDKTVNDDAIGMYLHWNGGMDTIVPLLKYCEWKEYRAPSKSSYGWVCLARIMGNYFGDGLSCGIDLANNLDCDNWDNGVYVIDGWKIVDRLYAPKEEQNYWKFLDMLHQINDAQPPALQFERDALEKLYKNMIEESNTGDQSA